MEWDNGMPPASYQMPTKFEIADSIVDQGSIGPLSKFVKVFIKMRDARAALKAEFERKDEVIKAQQEKVHDYLLGELNKLGDGAQSITTEFGTVYRDVEIKPSCQDWAIFWSFMRENDMLELMEKRLGRNAIKKYMDENEGRLPPGISVFKEATVKIRRK